VIDGRKIQVDIASQHVFVVVPPTFVPVHGAVRALGFAIGVAVVNEAAVEQRRNDFAKRMMDDTVAKRCGGNQAGLWIMHLDFDETARPPGAVVQFALQAQQVALQSGRECGGTRLAAFADEGLAERRM